MTRLVVAVAVATTMMASTVALADEADKPRPPHWGIGIGGFGALTGDADYGPAAEVEFYPGGRFGRYGVRAEYRGFESFASGFFAVGITFEAGASRPTLQLALHADVGFTYGTIKPLIAAGIQWQLWLKPPFGVSLDGGAYLILDGTDSKLALMQSLTVRIAR